MGLFLCPESEVNPCHINQSVPAPTPAAVGSLSVSNTAPSIKRSWTNNTTSTSATPSPTNATAEAGSASATATSSCIPFVRSVRSKASLLLPKRCTTSCRSQRAVAMRKATSWPSASPATRKSLPRAVTGGGGQIPKTIQSGQRRGASCEKTQIQTRE